MSFGEAYLVNPESFQGIWPGKKFGFQAMDLDLVGGPFRLDGLTALQRDEARKLFGCFATVPSDSGDERVTLSVLRCEHGIFRELDIRGRTYGFDVEYRGDVILLAGPGFAGCVERGSPFKATVWLSSDPETNGLAISNVLRVLVAERLLALGGVMVHSAAVIHEGRAWVFFGPSGIGKSTLAHFALHQGLTVLGDDINVILPEGSVLRVRDFPLAGELRRTHRHDSRATLFGLFRLRRGNQVAVRRLSDAEAYASLFACTPFVNDDSQCAERVYHNLTNALQAAVTAEVSLPRGADFREIVQAVEGME